MAGGGGLLLLILLIFISNFHAFNTLLAVYVITQYVGF